LLIPLRNVAITDPVLKWEYVDVFLRQCYPLLAAWVGDYPEQVRVSPVSYGAGLMCKILNVAPIGPSTFRQLDNSQEWHVYLELPDETNIEVLHTVGIHPIRSQF